MLFNKIVLALVWNDSYCETMNLLEKPPYNDIIIMIVIAVCIIVCIVSLILGRPKKLTEEQKAELLAQRIEERTEEGWCVSHRDGVFCQKEARHRKRHEAVVPQGYDPYYQTIYWVQD